MIRGLKDLLFLHKMNGAGMQLLLASQSAVQFDDMSLPRVELTDLPPSETSDTVLTDEEAARLRSLGYLQ